jgi:hypothetical protein
MEFALKEHFGFTDALTCPPLFPPLLPLDLQAALKGCINDCQCMEFALKKHFGFTDADIVMLRDDGRQKGPDFT